jgi:lipopolysaccharide export system permease protein
VKLLHRYIFFSVGATTLFSAALFAFVLVAANAVRDVIERVASGQLSAGMAAEMMALLIPFTMSFAAPMGLLMAILLVLGRMSARNEIVAIKSAGISLWRISGGILVLALMGVFVCAFVNNYYAPMARTRYREMLSNVVREAPLRFVVPGRFVRDFPGYVIYAGSREGSKLGNVWIWVLGPDRQVVKFLQARAGGIAYDEENNTLILDVYQATGEARNAATPDNVSEMRPQAVIDHASFSLPLDKLMSAKSVKSQPRKLSNMSLTELVVARREAVDALAGTEKGSEARRVALVMKTRTEYYISRNFAFAFSTLALALMAIPLGIHVSRQETYANMAVAVALGLVYFFLVFLCGWAERTPALHPELLVWLPNMAFLVLGISLMRRANQH